MMQAEALAQRGAEADQSIAGKLTRYHELLTLATIHLDDRRQFSDAINKAIDLLGYTPADICEQFNCSRMTVHRWTKGEAAPFPGMRRVIFEKLKTETERRLRPYRASPKYSYG
jgi:Homeodomain-like domain